MKTALLKILILLAVSTSSLAQSVSLVKDINNTANNYGSYPSSITTLGSVVVFVASDPIHGGELWVSNGSGGGTTLLKDILPGGGGSGPSYLTKIGSYVYFSANDGVNGTELWRTDGTSVGTTLVKDINSGPGSSYPSGFTSFNSFIYFSASDDSHGNELWKTDGTSGNTTLVSDYVVGSSSSYPGNFTAIGTSYLVFQAYDATNGYEPRSYNGTTISTFDIVSGTNGSNPYSFVYNGTKVLFIAYSGSAYYVYGTDGTTYSQVTGTYQYPSGLTALGSTVFFEAYDPAVNLVCGCAYGYEVWSSNGTSASRISDIYTSGSAYPGSFTVSGSYVFFSAYNGTSYYLYYTSGGAPTLVGTTAQYPGSITSYGSGVVAFNGYDATHGYELWKATVTGPAESLVLDILSGTGGSSPSSLAFAGSNVFFSADDGIHGQELWLTDFTAPGTTQVLDINTATDSNITIQTPNSTGYLMSAYDGSSQEIWKTDITTGGTTKISSINPGSYSYPSFLGKAGSLYLFNAYNATNGYELWKSDGANLANTLIVKDIAPGTNSSYPQNGVAMGGFVYFIANDGTNGTELWRSDGTLANTAMVKDIYAGANGSYPSYLTVIGSTLYFTADDGTNGVEVWKSDGTLGNASMVKNINLSGGSYPNYLTAVGSTLYFNANDGSNGYELWKSTDGTSVNTTLVKDINSTGDSYPSNLVAFNSTVYFQAYDGGTTGTELWKSDGTSVGTVLVKDIVSGVNSSYPNYLTAAGSWLYFSAYTSAAGNELWQTDGTSAGTTMVKDIYSGTLSSNLNNLKNINSTLYFSATDATGTVLYKSNGSSTGTIKATSAGTIYDSPGPAFYYNGKLIFNANTNANGNEPLTVMAEPLNQPTALIFSGIASTSISGSFTAAASSPSAPAGYIIIRKNGSAPTDLPVDGAAYSVGATIGTSTVAAIGAGTTFTDNFTGSSNPSAYYYAIYSYNNDGTANIYRPTSPLTGNSTPPAITPSAQPTTLTSTSVTTTSFTVSFTAATGSPNGYLVLEKDGSSAPTDVPVNGTGYTAGGTLGSSKIVYVGSATSFPQTSLASGSYSYAVFSYNGSTGTYIYLTSSPLTGTLSTLAAAPTAQPSNLVFSGATSSSINGSFTAASPAASGYLVIRNTTSPVDVPVSGTAYATGATIGSSTVAYSGSAATFNDTGLSAATIYFYLVFSVNGSGTSSNYLTTSPLSGNSSTLAVEPIAQPTSLAFSNIGVTSLSASFTASASLPVSGYLVVRNTTAPTGVPQDGTTYTVGATVAGTDVVAYVGSNNSFSETGLTGATKYFYAVYAFNNAPGPINYFASSPLTGNATTLAADNTPPTVTNSTNATATPGINIAIGATVTDAGSGVQSVSLKYRSISGDGTYTTVSMTSGSNNSWQYSVPSTEVGEIGLEYIYVATDNQNNVFTSSTPATVILSYSNKNVPYASFGSDVTNYRIISMPLNLATNTANAVFGTSLGTYDPSKWRLLHYTNGNNTELNGSSAFKIGDGYWFIAKTQATISLGTGTAIANVDAASPLVINLVQGWNQIGNPYLFNVSWSDITTASNNSLALKTYNGTWNTGDRLHVFEGGFVFAGQAATLKIPTQKNPGVQGGRFATENNELQNSLSSSDWEVSLKLKNNELTFNLGGFGMRETAKEDYDKYDDYTLPRLSDYLEVNHEKTFANIHCSRDIVPTSENHIWEFSVDTNKGGITEINWDNSYFGNSSDIGLVLVDLETKAVIDMKSSSGYSFESAKSHDFKIVYGNLNFVKENALPDELVINTVYPNPSSSSVSIGFTTPNYQGESSYGINVINLMGQPVGKIFSGDLPPGSYEFTWDGNDSGGSRVAQGMYFVEVRSGNQNKAKRIIIN